MRKQQIGIIGWSADLNYTTLAKTFASEVGSLLAKNDYIVVFGAEKDVDSLPTIAAYSARKSNGVTIGITYESGTKVFNEAAASSVIATGLVRGGGRETTLMLSCDAVIAIAGGSGTLNEICVAYQANIPVITIVGYGGWSEKLANTYLDDRKRYQFAAVTTPTQALQVLEKLLKKR